MSVPEWKVDRVKDYAVQRGLFEAYKIPVENESHNCDRCRWAAVPISEPALLS